MGPCSFTCSLNHMILKFTSPSVIYEAPVSRKYANIPPERATCHKFKLWEEGEVELHQFQEIGFRPRALRVNLSLIQLEFRVAVTLISAKPLPHVLMYASYLNPIYLLWMTENNSCC